MPSIGDTLREARMRQRLDVADVEQRTKIRAKYLRALENDEFDRLPGSTFVRSFLRTYAEVLGLDPHRLLEEYRIHHEPQDDLDQPAFAPPEHRRRRERRFRPGPPGPGALIATVLVLLFAFLLVLGLTGDEPSEDGGEQASTETADRAEAQRERARERAARRRERQRREAARPLALLVTPAEPTYVCVDKGDGTPIEFEGIVAEPRTFRGRRVRINLGKPSAEVRVNGRLFEIEQVPNPVGFEFTSSGARRPLDLGERPCARPSG